jgi:UDP-N-acetylmuramoylalanine--D-glutamate ligase
MVINENKSWLILGGGVSGLGAAEYLKSRNQTVTIHDDNKPAQTLSPLGVELRQVDVSEIPKFHYVVPSPGIAHTHLLIQEAKRRGIPLISDIDLALSDYQEKIVAVTGTNGKTTTCLLIADILNKNGLPSLACGNVGKSPSSLRATASLKGILSLELSSYQLESISDTRFDCALATSFSFDHMSRHGSLEGYFDTKWKAFTQLKPGALGVMAESFYRFGVKRGADFSALSRLAIVGFEPGRAPLLTHSNFPKKNDELCGRFTISGDSVYNESGERIFSVPTSKFPFSFDQMNYAMSALALRSITNLSFASILASVATFAKPPHRMERVGYLGKKLVIDDSKSTNLESVIGAVQNFDRCVLLLGGIDKGESFEPLQQYQNKIEAIFSFGRSNEKIKRELSNSFPVYNHARLEHAMMDLEDNLDRFSSPVVLFSPGCASFDEFKNFEDRGCFFQGKIKGSKRFKV